MIFARVVFPTPGGPQRINDGTLDELVITDTIPMHGQSDKVTVLSATRIIGETIRRITNNESVNSIFID
ncbi:MAG: hypothetical protein P8Y16_08075 [Sulfurimonas sp.]